ncbi:MAG: HD domain-containing protein [Chloroflexota bacterium]
MSNEVHDRIIADVLWGEFELEHEVLVELIASEPVQRLHGIHQAGASYYLFPSRHPHTRFEHSIGVMRILALLRAGIDEQVAGLLHDVPHTAFSHTVDIVFPSVEHNFHEQFQHDIVMQSSIPAILERHGVSLHAALEPDRFPLLEQPLPDLCADRLDYALRDLHGAGMITQGEANEFISHLVPTPRGPVLDSVEMALWFARLFLKANDTLWTSAEEAGSYWALAGAIRRAYATGGFTDADLFSTDDAAMHTLRSLGDPIVNAFLEMLEPGTEYYHVEGGGPFFTTHMKQRVVDPLVVRPKRSAPERLSKLVPEYSRELDERKGQRRTEYRLWSPQIGDDLRQSLAFGS